MNDDVAWMLWVMNKENCPDKNRHYCHICDQRIFCPEYEPGNIPGNKSDKTV